MLSQSPSNVSIAICIFILQSEKASAKYYDRRVRLRHGPPMKRGNGSYVPLVWLLVRAVNLRKMARLLGLWRRGWDSNPCARYVSPPREQLSNARGVLQEQLDEEALGLCCLAVVPMLPSTIGLALRCSASGTMEAADVPPTHGGSLAALAGPLELGSTPGRFREGILPLLPFHGVDLTFSYHPHPPWRRSPQSPAFTETC